jgi:hypothetical protein
MESFTMNFSLKLTNANADGMAFVMESNGRWARCENIGYGPDAPMLPAMGINKNVAVVFDLYSSTRTLGS